MNLNLGGLSESLKYSYQQFCKQDAEGREHSRQLLMKLHHFDARHQELALQTQAQKVNLSQYERMLMQQNPLLWAHLQRSFATEIPDCEPLRLPLISVSRAKETREVAINTSDSSSNSQPSLQDEGVWPHSPSPHPEAFGLQSKNPIPAKTNNHPSKISSMNYLAQSDTFTLIKNGNHSNSNNIPTTPQSLIHDANVIPHQGIMQQEPSRNFPASTPEVELRPILMDSFIPESSSTPKVPIHRQPSPPPVHYLQPVQLAFTSAEPIAPAQNLNRSLTPPPADENFQDTLPLTSPSSAVELRHDEAAKSDNGPEREDTIHRSTMAATGYQKNETSVTPEAITSPVEAKSVELKPFRLDSESEGADDVLSGPISGQAAGDDDSDSFWS